MKGNGSWARLRGGLMVTVVAVFVLTPGAWAAAKYKSLHNFTGGKGGGFLSSALIFDQAGNLYGTAYAGGSCRTGNCGLVFELTPDGRGGWKEKALYRFKGGTDGSNPYASLIFDAAGNLYGTTVIGGAYNSGVVFKLAANTDGSWTETVLYSFCSLTNCRDGSFPEAALVLDQAGNFYGTAYEGGNLSACDGVGCGVVFRLAQNASGGWVETVLYAFCSITGCLDGALPSARVIFDQVGSLYGSTQSGGDCHSQSCSGVVFKLKPQADGSWTENVLYSFCSQTKCHDGIDPFGLVFDGAGNLYGMTAAGGNRYGNCNHEEPGCGLVFELMPKANGKWAESVLYRFTSVGGNNPSGDGPLIFDQAENLYGTTSYGGNTKCSGEGCGVVFELSTQPTGGWKKTVLYRFTDVGGSHPSAGLIFDAVGNLYGTTFGDRVKTFGSVFEITP